jgi:hypothetical protein
VVTPLTTKSEGMCSSSRTTMRAPGAIGVCVTIVLPNMLIIPPLPPGDGGERAQQRQGTPVQIANCQTLLGKLLLVYRHTPAAGHDAESGHNQAIQAYKPAWPATSNGHLACARPS